jgi:hypothetical protein
MLAGAETVEDGTAGKTPVGEVLVDLTAEVAAQVRARPSGRLVDGELRRPGERGGDAAETGAPRAVGGEFQWHDAARLPRRGAGAGRAGTNTIRPDK